MTSSNRQKRRRRLSESVVIDALQRSGGVVSDAAKSLGVPRTTVSNYLARPEVRQVCEDARETLCDEAETQLAAAVERGESWAIRLALLRSSAGRHRGYGTTNRIETANGVDFTHATVETSGVLVLPIEKFLDRIGANSASGS